MTLVEAGKLELDAPVSTYLRRWKLPESDFDNDGVTVRRLLSHTAGLTDGLGYGGFNRASPCNGLRIH
jgi:CubicO group peptidase (beta-lactamase class C family)